MPVLSMAEGPPVHRRGSPPCLRILAAPEEGDLPRSD